VDDGASQPSLQPLEQKGPTEEKRNDRASAGDSGKERRFIPREVPSWVNPAINCSAAGVFVGGLWMLWSAIPGTASLADVGMYLLGVGAVVLSVFGLGILRWCRELEAKTAEYRDQPPRALRCSGSPGGRGSSSPRISAGGWP
jgi:hypothetical protein